MHGFLFSFQVFQRPQSSVTCRFLKELLDCGLLVLLQKTSFILLCLFITVQHLFLALVDALNWVGLVSFNCVVNRELIIIKMYKAHLGSLPLGKLMLCWNEMNSLFGIALCFCILGMAVCCNSEGSLTSYLCGTGEEFFVVICVTSVFSFFYI